MINWLNKKDKKFPSMLAIYWPIVPLLIWIFFIVLLTPECWAPSDTVLFRDWQTPSQKFYDVCLWVIVLSPSVVITPVIEELFFRKFLWGLSSKVFRFEGGHIATFLVVTLLFALCHKDLGHIIGVMPLSIFLGYLRLKTGSIKPCIVVHAVNNLSVFIFSFWPCWAS